MSRERGRRRAGRGGGAWDAPGRGPMVLYGRNPVREALRGRRAVRHVWATAPAAREPWLAGTAVEVAGEEEIARRAGTEAHQGVAALADPYPYADPARLLDLPGPLLVALDQVTDPQNLGAICRTAEAVGAAGVVVPERRSAEVTPAAAKASAGAVEHVPIARVRNLADFLADAKAAGCWCYGADPDAPTPYDVPDYRGGTNFNPPSYDPTARPSRTHARASSVSAAITSDCTSQSAWIASMTVTSGTSPEA